MRRPDLTDLVIVVAAAAIAVLVTDREVSPYLATVLFSLVMLSLLGIVLRQSLVTGRAAYAEQRRARKLAAIDSAGTVGKAVLEERTRLSGGLDTCIREALEAIRSELASPTAFQDPRESARRIHQRSREASSELRRQLGLLRAHDESPGTTVDYLPPAGLTWRSITLSALVAVVAAVEGWVSYATGETTTAAFNPIWSPLLTALAAATVIGHRIAPATAAAALAALCVIPRLTVGVMIGSGLWMVVTVGGLTWALARRGFRDIWALIATAAMAAAVVWSRLLDDRGNAAICVVLLVVSWILGAVVGGNRRRQTAAATRAAARQAELDADREEAVRAERLAVARELHDVVSHAVGVIAIQAGAAEAAWPADPETTLGALDTIDAAAASALAELDRVVPGELNPAAHDLDALVGRIRATGTTVRLTTRGFTDRRVDGLVYRVVQEGLTNAVRHAPGADIEVTVVADEAGLRVRVTDDGRGPSGEPRRGFGLAGLRERVSLAGGTLRVGQQDGGEGFTVEATLPIRQTGVM
jgi:signal transduction histidine kinase